MQVEVLEDQLFTLDSQQSRDMEARPSKCRAANFEVSRILYDMDRIQVMTAVSKHKKEAISIMEQLDKLMDIIHSGFRPNLDKF